MSAILCLGGGWQQEPSIKMLKEYGFEIILVDPNDYPFCLELATEFIQEDLKKYENIYNKLKPYLEIYEIKSVVAINNDFGLVSARLLGDALRTNQFNNSAKITLSNKKVLAQWFRDNSKEPVRLQLIESEQSDLNKIIEYSNKKKLIIKPIDSAGSRGVSVIKIGASRNEILKLIEFSAKYSSSREVIIEEFIEGDEYSVEVVNSIKYGVEIVCISRRYMFGLQSARAIETIPNKSDNFKKISDYIKNFLIDVGHIQGLLHIEIIIDAKEFIHVIDIGERGGGYWVADKLASYKLGININLYMTLLEMNIEPPQKRKSENEFLLVYEYPNEPCLMSLENYTLQEVKILNPIIDIKNGLVDASRSSIKLYKSNG